jgi:hypothetical protein
MVIAGVNQPIGRTYNKAFGEVLKREELNKLDSGTRGKLFVILKHLAEIEEWRERLEPARRMELNHPTAIVRNWGKTESGRRALQSAKKKRKKKQTVKPNLLEENVELQDRVQRLTERVTEVEQERDQLKREVSRGFSEPALALKALVHGEKLKIDDLTGLTYREVTEWIYHVDKLANERERVFAKRRSVNSVSGGSA